MFGKRTYRSRDLIGSIILWSFQRLAACLHESGIWSRILCNFDRDSPYNIRLLIWAIDVRLLCPYVIVPYHVLFSVLFLHFDIITFLFICITCVTYNQNLEITALFTDLNISLFLYCRVHRDLPVCLSVGGGHTSNDYECGIYGLCQECVSDSMYIRWFVDRQCCVMTVWYVTFSTMSQFPWQLVAHSEDDSRLVSTFV